MDRRKFADGAYYVLLTICVFVFGYFTGRMSGDLEMRVTTSSESPVLEIISVETEEPESDGPVNLNTAQKADLETLPGIGPELAERILLYRSQVGRFVAVEQLMDVDGIGEKRLEQIRDLITVGGE